MEAHIGGVYLGNPAYPPILRPTSSVAPSPPLSYCSLARKAGGWSSFSSTQLLLLGQESRRLELLLLHSVTAPWPGEQEAGDTLSIGSNRAALWLVQVANMWSWTSENFDRISYWILTIFWWKLSVPDFKFWQYIQRNNWICEVCHLCQPRFVDTYKRVIPNIPRSTKTYEKFKKRKCEEKKLQKKQ